MFTHKKENPYIQPYLDTMIKVLHLRYPGTIHQPKQRVNAAAALKILLQKYGPAYSLLGYSLRFPFLTQKPNDNLCREILSLPISEKQSKRELSFTLSKQELPNSTYPSEQDAPDSQFISTALTKIYQHQKAEDPEFLALLSAFFAAI